MIVVTYGSDLVLDGDGHAENMFGVALECSQTWPYFVHSSIRRQARKSRLLCRMLYSYSSAQKIRALRKVEDARHLCGAGCNPM